MTRGQMCLNEIQGVLQKYHCELVVSGPWYAKPAADGTFVIAFELASQIRELPLPPAPAPVEQNGTGELDAAPQNGAIIET